MRAILIAVGSELLDQGKVDTNSLYITKKLMEWGILVDMKVVAGDDITTLSWLIKNAYKRAQLIVITGGLGPTEDDLTREAVASALKLDLEFNEELLGEIKKKFKKIGMEMPQINTRQAFVLTGSEIIANDAGTAPGLFINDECCRVLLLPGPPHEMKPIFDRVVADKIAPLSNYFIYRRSFKLVGLTESKVDSMIAETYSQYKNPKTTILASPGVIEIHLLGRSKKTVEEAQTLTDQLAEKIKDKVEKYLFTEEEITIEEFVIERLTKLNKTISVAESCTGGGLGNIITSVPGSSKVFLGGVIAYSNELKINLLGVTEKTLDKYGAVSKEAAAEMARGIRQKTNSDLGVAITGIAGPGGASKYKPVGLVFMHLNSNETDFGVYKIFPGERNLVKRRAINYLLHLIREYVSDLEKVGDEV